MRLPSVVSEPVSISGINLAVTASVHPSSPSSGAAAADVIAHFVSVRRRLLGIAIRILGGVADAEDVVQDVWIRWQATDHREVRDRTGYLVTVTTHTALNVATSAHARREFPVGDRIPETGHPFDDPALDAERTEAVETAMLLLLARLSPIERAVFVLREAFDYPFRAIAEALGVSEPNARQLARRARIRLANDRRTPVEPVERDLLVGAFLDAARSGEVVRLEQMLTEPLRRQEAA